MGEHHVCPSRSIGDLPATTQQESILLRCRAGEQIHPGFCGGAFVTEIFRVEGLVRSSSTPGGTFVDARRDFHRWGQANSVISAVGFRRQRVLSAILLNDCSTRAKVSR